MKSKIIKTICIILFAAFLFSPFLSSIMDKLILPEEKTPGYAKYLRAPYDYNGTVLKETYKRAGNRNLVTNYIGERQGDGYTLTANEDGSITFSGTNLSDKTDYYRICSWSKTGLANDDYTLIFNELSEDFSIYFEGMVFNTGGEYNYEALSRTSGASFITDNSKYSQYNLVLSIKPGAQSDSSVFYPMLCKSSDIAETYEPCTVSNLNSEGKSYKYAGVKMLKSNLYDLSADDWNALLTDLSYSKNKWFFILLFKTADAFRLLRIFSCLSP